MSIMTGNLDTQFSMEEIRSKPGSERMDYVEKMYVTYPRANTIIENIRHSIRINEYLPEPLCLLVTGPAGSGKTTILEKILAENPSFIKDDSLNVPVVMATIDAQATVGSLATRILDGIGDPLSESGLISRRMHRLENYFDDVKTKVLLIDEIQHFIDQDNNKVLQTVSDTLKNLIKTKKLTCVLCGKIGQAEKVVDSNSQLARLFSDPKVLEPFTWDEKKPESIKEFRQLLSEIEKILPLRENSNLFKLETAWRIFSATEGLMGHLMKLIRISTVYALERGYEALDYNLLAEVFDEYLAEERRNIHNPFLDLPTSVKSSNLSIEQIRGF